MTGHKNCNNCQ